MARPQRRCRRRRSPDSSLGVLAVTLGPSAAEAWVSCQPAVAVPEWRVEAARRRLTRQDIARVASAFESRDLALERTRAR